MSLNKKIQFNKTNARKGIFLYQGKAKKKGKREKTKTKKQKNKKQTDKTYVCSVLLLFLNTYVTQHSVTIKSSGIRQKGESQNQCFKTRVFLQTPVLRFALLPYYRRNKVTSILLNSKS